MDGRVMAMTLEPSIHPVNSAALVDLNMLRSCVDPPLSAATTPIRRIRCVFPFRANLSLTYECFL